MTSKMQSSPAHWIWATELQEPQSGTEQELRACLASGLLPPFTLVWREGWGEWIPAMQVAELAESLPEGLALTPRPPRRASRPGRGAPPVPVSEYPKLRQMAKEGPRVASAESEPSGVHPASLTEPSVWAGRDSSYPEDEVITSEVPAAILQEAAEAMQEPEPPADLGIAAAVEEARASVAPVSGPISGAPISSWPPALPDSPMLEELQASSVPIPRLESESEEPTLVDTGPSSSPPSSSPGSSRGTIQPPAWPKIEVESTPSSGRGSRRWALALGAGALLAAVVGALWWTRSSASEESFRGAESASEAVASAERGEGAESSSHGSSSTGRGEPSLVAPAAPAEVVSPPCKPLGEPVRIDDWAIIDVPPLLAPAATPGHVAVGYAQSHEQALGVMLDVGTLETTRAFGESRKGQIFSVAPLVASGEVHFRTERSGPEMAFSRSLDLPTPYRIGMNDAHIVVGKLSEPARRLWRIPRGAIITVPSIAHHDGGITIATRVGRVHASVHVGVLSTEGEALTEFPRLDLPKGELSAPVVAASKNTTVVAVVAPKQEKGEGDALVLSRAANGSLPAKTVELDIFDEPVSLRGLALTALPTGAFALAWSEGTGWERRVRLLELSSKLEPLGPPADITVPNSEFSGATAGSLYWLPPTRPTPGDGQHLLLFHFLSREQGHGLYVSDIACEPVEVTL